MAETGIVTLISYRHYIKIVGNNKLWPDMLKESWNIHLTKILICSHTLNMEPYVYSRDGWSPSIYGSECQIWKALLRIVRCVLLRLIQIRISPKRGKCTWNSVTNRSHSTYGSSARSDSHRAFFCPISVVSGWKN
jgi:hypothetical protein